jgi:hypothetical protein
MTIAADGALVARLDCERLAGQGRRLCEQKRAAYAAENERSGIAPAVTD